MKMSYEMLLLRAEHEFLTNQRKFAEADFVHRKIKRLRTYQLQWENKRCDEEGFIEWPATEDSNAVRTN